MKDLPYVFENKIDHEINNYQKVYVSFSDNKRSNDLNLDSDNVLKKISNIFNDRHYIRKPNVSISTTDGDILCQILSYNSNYVFTMDGSKVPVSKINDVKII